jgi:putative ABC transport system permease protein
MRYLVVSGLISNGQNSAIFLGAGYDDTQGVKIRGDKWAWNTVAGKPLFTAPGTDSLLLGMGLADRMGCVYDHDILLKPDGSYLAKERPLKCPGSGLQLSVTTEHSQVNAMTLPAIGVTDYQLREFNDKLIALPLTTAQQLFDTDRISRELVLLWKPSEIASFTGDFLRHAREQNLDVEAIPWLDHPVTAIAKGGLEVLGVFRGLFLGVVAVIAAMSVANSMMKSINERIREIGTLRSFGFRRLDIVLLFSLEGLFLGLVSCAAGVVLTSVLAWVLSHVGITFKAGVLSTPMPLMFKMAFSLWLTTALGLGSITFLASWLVSLRAARMNVADALRYTA